MTAPWQMTPVERLAVAEHAFEVATSMLAQAEALVRIIESIDVVGPDNVALRSAHEARRAAVRAEFSAKALASALKRALRGVREPEDDLR